MDDTLNGEKNCTTCRHLPEDEGIRIGNSESPECRSCLAKSTSENTYPGWGTRLPSGTEY